MPRIFLSYGGPDQAFALRLQGELERHGIETFAFCRDAIPGQMLHRVMRDGVNTAERVVLICSRGSLDRTGVVNEIEETLQREAREGGQPILIPITLDGFVHTQWRPKEPGLAMAIRDRVIADFTGTQRNQEKFVAEAARLAQAIAAVGDPGYIVETLRKKYTVCLADVKGREAHLTWETLFVPRSPGISRLFVRNLTSTGSHRVVSSNLGRIGKIVDEGGRDTVHVDLAEPLPVGEEVRHEIQIVARDSYLGPPPYTATVTMSDASNELLIGIEFPKERRCVGGRCWRELGGRRFDGPPVDIDKQERRISTLVNKPQLGAVYGLEFDW